MNVQEIMILCHSLPQQIEGHRFIDQRSQFMYTFKLKLMDLLLGGTELFANLEPPIIDLATFSAQGKERDAEDLHS